MKVPKKHSTDAQNKETELLNLPAKIGQTDKEKELFHD